MAHWGETFPAYAGMHRALRFSFSSNASRSIHTDIDGYSVENLRLGYRSDAGWELHGWVRNLRDTEYCELLATIPGDTGLIASQLGDPWRNGITVRVARRGSTASWPTRHGMVGATPTWRKRLATPASMSACNVIFP